MNQLKKIISQIDTILESKIVELGQRAELYSARKERAITNDDCYRRLKKIAVELEVTGKLSPAHRREFAICGISVKELSNES